ncbi:MULTISPECIES: hypothetical protein [Streptomyces]|uniref:hypothetical protein n=1 Tax=Streptomyces TaxID=1883 RepID=UPI0007893A24|nr:MULTISPECIES: hypothetical protein [unclassified Streptomyces]AVH93730.1 hypothetical protein C5L38_00375 [Streptomyces sp. WAC00288]KYG51840.1 hypothetical protein AWI43_31295 [Streptomyces sp. WAC04657]
MSSCETIQYTPDGLLTIPGDRANDFSLGFAVFDDSVPALRAFILDRLRKENIRPAASKAKYDAVIPVRVGLVPRPDNDYDTRAVSVTAPPCDGGSVLDRHMGYLYSSALHVTSQSIRDLTDETGMPVGCHGWIELYDLKDDSRFYDDEDGEGGENDDDAGWEPSRDELVSWAEQKAFGYAVGSVRVLLPERQTVRALVDAYLAARRQEAHQCTKKEPAQVGVEQGLRRALAERLAIRLRTGLSHRAVGGAWGRETERDRARQRRDAEAQPLLHAWETYRSSPHGFRDLRAVTRSVFHHTRILVLDGSGVEVGQYHQPDGPLTLVDERARAEALDALRTHGVDVDTPEDLVALGGFPDAVIVVGGDRWSIRLSKPGAPRGGLPEAGWFDPDSGTLTVYAASLAEPLTVLLRRHGVRPLLVTWGTPGEEVERHNLRAAVAPAAISPVGRSSRVTAIVQQLIPEPHRRWLNAKPDNEEALAAKTGSLLPPLIDDAAENQYYRRALEALFGAPVNLAERGPCRLCGRSSQSARSGLFYCHSCCVLAGNGVLRDTGVDGAWTEATVYALRRLAEIEFSGPPSLTQLDRVCVPFEDHALVDEVMLCRFLAPRPGSALLSTRPTRPARTWTEWLGHAGFLMDGVRTSMGMATTATDGHPCRSLFERHVDDFLHHWGVNHETEPAYPRHPKLNTTGLRADWRLADGTFVEALGLMTKEAYVAKVARKRELARHHGLRLVTVTAEDLNRLPEVFADWLPKGSVG